MKVFKTAAFIIFNIFYFILGVYLAIFLVGKVKSFFPESNIDVAGSLILSAIIVVPYLLFKLCKCFDEKTSKYYYIVQNLVLLIFTIAAIFKVPGFEYATQVWGIIFILITVIDTITEIVGTNENEL